MLYVFTSFATSAVKLPLWICTFIAEAYAGFSLPRATARSEPEQV
jgi:hypothetical protein